MTDHEQRVRVYQQRTRDLVRALADFDDFLRATPDLDVADPGEVMIAQWRMRSAHAEWSMAFEAFSRAWSPPETE